MKNINRKEALKMIESTKGKFFSVTFEKKNGEIRNMNCRTGVKKGQAGGVATYKANPANIGVYDMVTDDYRCFNIERLKNLKVGGQEYTVIDAVGDNV